jgi:hypothetical protein
MPTDHLARHVRGTRVPSVKDVKTLSRPFLDRPASGV